MTAHRRRVYTALGPLALSGLAACHCAQPTVPVYPPLPSAPQSGALHVVFEPADGVVEVALPCARNEQPDNGLDDDCDGHVDDRAALEPYLAITHEREVAVEVVLLRISGPPVARFVSGTSAACSAPAAAHVDTFNLDIGSYELVAKVSADCGAHADAALSVSLGQGHARQVFASGNLSDTPRVLGRVIVTPDTAGAR